MPSKLPKVTSTDSISDLYTKRILGNVLNRDIFEVLEGSPVAVERAIRGMTAAQLQKAPGKGKWSIGQIVHHLCDAELVMAFRFRMAIAQSGSPILAYEESLWAKHLGYNKSDTQQKALVFKTVRAETVGILKALKKSELERFGMHSERGKETVLRMAQMLSGHDVNHVKRIIEIRAHFLKKRTAR